MGTSELSENLKEGGGEVTCDGLSSYPGRSINSLSHVKLQRLG